MTSATSIKTISDSSGNSLKQHEQLYQSLFFAMNISLNWLKTYLPDLDKTPEEIDEALTLVGFEVDAIEHKGLPLLEKVVVGEVLTKEQHPNADRLSVCSVNVGDSENPAGIVCGAKNFKVGDRVPVATVGAELPGGFKIEKAKLRGVDSAGMMCSARELGLGDDHAGLYILEDRPEIGTPINDVFPGGDIVFDVEITPNRPDCLSHIGLARELSAHFDLELHLPETKLSAEDFDPKANDALIDSVAIESTDSCHYYTAHCIEGVEIKESPAWLKEAIESIGLRPINNVVDVTNYVLHETGQPLHAFDVSKIKGNKIIVRKAKPGESIITLDDKKRELSENHSLIADAERGLVVAGVMGSIDAEVDDNTVDILLESAWFEPKQTRKTSRELGLSTDSSYRFERGIDPLGVDKAAYRALDLILETAGGTLKKQSIIEGSNELPKCEVVVGPDYIRDRCGFGPEDAQIKKALVALGLGVEVATKKPLGWKITIPSHRGDLSRPIDIVEEFLRIYGTDKIPETPVQSEACIREHSREWIVRRQLASTLQGKGFSEIYNYTLLDGANLEAEEGSLDALKLLNPISSDQTHLRPSLIPGLVDAIVTNQNHNRGSSRFFEWGRTYKQVDDELVECLGIGFAIHENPVEKHWLERKGVDFYEMKALVTDLLAIAGLKLSDNLISMDPIPLYGQKGHFVVGAGIRRGGFEAEFGMLDLKWLKEADVDGIVWAGSIAILPTTIDKPKKPYSYIPFSHFPPSYKDLALVVGSDVPAAKVTEAMNKTAQSVSDKTFKVESISLFDVYEGKGLEEGHKSLAYTITFRGTSGTLSDKVVNEAFDKIQSAIEKRTAFRVRR
jgi:phenylalanyl-tRNA synthetase beta chain